MSPDDDAVQDGNSWWQEKGLNKTVAACALAIFVIVFLGAYLWSRVSSETGALFEQRSEEVKTVYEEGLIPVPVVFYFREKEGIVGSAPATLASGFTSMAYPVVRNSIFREPDVLELIFEDGRKLRKNSILLSLQTEPSYADAVGCVDNSRYWEVSPVRRNASYPQLVLDLDRRGLGASFADFCTIELSGLRQAESMQNVLTVAGGRYQMQDRLFEISAGQRLAGDGRLIANSNIEGISAAVIQTRNGLFNIVTLVSSDRANVGTGQIVLSDDVLGATFVSKSASLSPISPDGRWVAFIGPRVNQKWQLSAHKIDLSGQLVESTVVAEDVQYFEDSGHSTPISWIGPTRLAYVNANSDIVVASYQSGGIWQTDKTFSLKNKRVRSHIRVAGLSLRQEFTVFYVRSISAVPVMYEGVDFIRVASVTVFFVHAAQAGNDQVTLPLIIDLKM